MKIGIRHILLMSLVMVLLGGLAGSLAVHLVLAFGGYRAESTFHISSHGQYAPGTLLQHVTETFRNQIVFERKSWAGDKPDAVHGIMGFRDMLAGACILSGWTTGFSIGLLYCGVQFYKLFRRRNAGKDEELPDRAFATPLL